MLISVIMPFFNEKESLPILVESLILELDRLKKDYEIILVDDGSDDGTVSEIKTQTLKLKIKNQNLRILTHRKRKGKGEALKTGIKNARGEILVFMDADLQDDPRDLSKFLKKIDEGYDFVNGYRFNRQDIFLVKIYSKIASWLLKIFLNSPFSDINCGFKAFKSEVLKDFVFYGNNFRFFPLFAFYQGFKVTEVPVLNHHRRFGKTKFGSRKIFIGLFDMLTAYFLYKFSERPLHFFGIVGSIISLIGFLILIILAYERIFNNVLLYRRPVFWLGVLMMIIGVQVVAIGIIGELMVYLSKKSNDKN